MSHQRHIRRCQPAESRALRQWIIDRHYLRSAPPGYIAALEFLSDGQRVGAMLLGRPTSRSLPADLWLELTRMYFVDEAPRNSESNALALMRRWVRTWMPTVRGLISYSDPAAGHGGTIYLADGWAPFGRTRNSRAGWSSRPGRAAAPAATPKQRWVRTP